MRGSTNKIQKPRNFSVLLNKNFIQIFENLLVLVMKLVLWCMQLLLLAVSDGCAAHALLLWRWLLYEYIWRTFYAQIQNEMGNALC